MNIEVVKDKITIEEAREIAKEFYDPMIKGVADINRGIMALGGEYHMDANLVLIEDGSDGKDIWGFNIYLDREKSSPDWIEYTSLINIRPIQNNRSMEIKSEEIRKKVREILEKLIKG